MAKKVKAFAAIAGAFSTIMQEPASIRCGLPGWRPSAPVGTWRNFNPGPAGLASPWITRTTRASKCVPSSSETLNAISSPGATLVRSG